MPERVELRIRTAEGTIVLRAPRRALARPSPEEEWLGREALFALRARVEWGDIRGTVQALQLARALECFGHGTLLREEPLSERERRALVHALERELRFGRIHAEPEPEIRWVLPIIRTPPLPPLPPPPRTAEETFYEVRFVDEVGQAVGTFPVEIALGGEVREVQVSGAGIALLEHVAAMTATLSAPDVEGMEAALDARWSGPRPGKPPKEGNTTEIVFQGQPMAAIPLKPGTPNRVVLEPPFGTIFLELWDKTGRVRHAERAYTLRGPMSFDGKTNAEGRLRHEGVFPGDYQLGVTLEFFDGRDQTTDVHETPAVVLPLGAGAPQIRMVGAVPISVLGRIRAAFSTNKAFVLPPALPAFAEARRLLAAHHPCRLLVVGHADAAGDAAYNDGLSLERARSAIAFIKDDVDAWLGFYDAGVPEKQRWGRGEDRLMLLALPDFRHKPRDETGVRWFQRTRALQVDGVAGSQTRRQLVTEYMALDGGTLDDEGIEVDALAHGCGEYFPLDEPAEAEPAEGASVPKGGERDPEDRRVELFFFDPEFGIVPGPAGDNSVSGSAEYPAWCRNVVEAHDLAPGALPGRNVTLIEVADALFRTNSAVVLPEGERPDAGSHEALTSIGVFATALRFNDERGPRSLLAAGHADTTGDVDFNQKLSEERAGCALAALTGDRDAWKTLCDERHTTADIKQILRWVSRAFHGLVFDCDPGAVDDNAGTLPDPVRRFQAAYNRNKAGLGASGPALQVDGAVGPMTWGAFFDCYEHALREELGEDATGIAALRSRLRFVDDENKSLGFGEHHPVEELGTDGYESQSNRRVEILFFEEGEEPDVVHAKEDPETSELYLPGWYAREAIEPLATATHVRVRLQVNGSPVANQPFELHAGGALLATGRTSAAGLLATEILRAEPTVTISLPEVGLVFDVTLGALEPVSETKGAQRRLAQLGYFHSSIDGKPGQEFEQALRCFQEDSALLETGLLDAPTRSTLTRKYGS